VEAKRDERGRRQLVPTGEPDVFVECDDVLIAVGQENHFPWIERDIGLEFGPGQDQTIAELLEAFSPS